MKRMNLLLLLLVWGFNSVYAQDKDNLIDIFDLVMVAREFGQNDVGLLGDVNGDISVNIFDLVMVAQQFGQSGASLSGDVSKPQGIIETNSMVVIDTSVGDSVVGNDLYISIKINQGSNIAGYQFTLEFDSTAFEFVSIANADFLPAGAFAIPPKVNEGKITLAATSLAGGTNGDGTLAKATLKVLKKSDSALKLSGVKLVDPDARAISSKTVDGSVKKSLVQSNNILVVKSGVSSLTAKVLSLDPKITVTNKTRKRSMVASSDGGAYQATFIDFTQAVARIGDIIEVIAKLKSGEIVGKASHRLTAAEITKALVEIDIAPPPIVVLVDPAVVESPAVGDNLNVSIKINQANNVAGYEFTLEFDGTALEYVTIVNSDFLPAETFAIPPEVNVGKVRFLATSPTVGVQVAMAHWPK